MKKLIIASFVAALFAACNNTPAVTESAANVAKLTTWVDSIKNVIATATTHDSTSWANYTAEFNTAVSSIKMEELDETGKKALEAANTAWAEVGTTYSAAITKEKEAAAQMMASDTTKAAATIEAGKTIIEKGKEVVKEGKDMIKK